METNAKQKNMCSAVPQSQLNEADIKAIILSRPEIRTAKPVVASEYVIGRRIRRADLVILSNEFIAFEIKSDLDTLSRLENQVNEYGKYFDRVVVAATTKHIKKIQELDRTDFDLWEITADNNVKMMSESHTLRQQRKAADQLRLLTKLEQGRFLGQYNQSNKEFDLEIVSQAIRNAFLFRHQASSDGFWSAVGTGKVDIGKLQLLSRFADLRNRTRERLSREKDYWSEWHRNAETFLKQDIHEPCR